MKKIIIIGGGEAINYTRCCTELRENNKPVDGGTSYATLGKTKGKSDMQQLLTTECLTKVVIN